MDKFVTRKAQPKATTRAASPPVVVVPVLPKFAPAIQAHAEESGNDEVLDDRDDFLDDHWDEQAPRRSAHREARKKRESAPRTMDQHFVKVPKHDDDDNDENEEDDL